MKTKHPKPTVYELRDPEGSVVGVYASDNLWAGWTRAFDRQSPEFRRRYWKREGPTKVALRRMGWKFVPCAHIAEDLRGIHELPRLFLAKLRAELNKRNDLNAGVTVPPAFEKRYAEAKVDKKLYGGLRATKAARTGKGKNT